MSKHTPGPWVLIQGDRTTKEMVITTESRIEAPAVSICELDTDFIGVIGEEQEANACLISAAPDLLEALEMIVAEADSYTERTGKPVYNWLDTARAAIAKAKGGTK
jgi:hypothetical protein